MGEAGAAEFAQALGQRGPANWWSCRFDHAYPSNRRSSPKGYRIVSTEGHLIEVATVRPLLTRQAPNLTVVPEALCNSSRTSTK